jgi:CHAD domain-containing protein
LSAKLAQALQPDRSTVREFAMIFHAITPLDIFYREIAILRDHHPGILDGDHGSIHDARIATRRIREVLPLTGGSRSRDVSDDLRTMIKRMGRALGRVRDADVRIELLRYLEARIPHAAPSLVLVRQRAQRDRLLIMRKLVKRFERLGVDRELARLAAGGARRSLAMWAGRFAGWREHLRRRVEERGSAACDAVTRATGVYFPKRVHAARIAVKKFRYAAEIAVDSSVLDDGAALRTLKKTQDVLGDLHDRQSLIDDLRQIALADVRIDAGHLALVEHVVEADVADRHVRFLTRRPQLRIACDEIRAGVRRQTSPIRAASIVGALAVVGLGTRRRLQRREGAGQQGEGTVSVRIAVPLGTPTET